LGNSDLILQFTRREVELRHKGSRLGHFWSIFRPASLLGLYLFVFGVIFRSKFNAVPGETTYDYAVALFLSISFWNVFGEAMAAAPILVLGQPNFVKKVVFPLEIISVSNVTTSLYHGGLSIVLALVFACFGHTPLSWAGIAALPALLLPLALITLGVSWALSAVGLFLRDINQMIPFLSQALLYVSAVVYPPAQIRNVAPAAWAVLRFNPLLWLMDETRRVVLWHFAPNYPVWGYIYITSAAIAGLGYGIFRVLRPYFAEVI
jgi:lipopolysaccharide transport system permease protein